MGVGLRIELEEIGHQLILRIKGRLDATSAPLLEKKIDSLIAEHHHHLLLDFSRVDYLSSAGMRVLLSSTKKLRAKNGDLLLFALVEDVQEIIRMAGFDKVFRIYSTEKEALQQHK
jgi:anti-anti-sigma factor